MRPLARGPCGELGEHVSYGDVLLIAAAIGYGMAMNDVQFQTTF